MLKRVLVIGMAVSLLGLAGCGELKDLRKQNASLKAQLKTALEERDGLAGEVNTLRASLATIGAERDKAREDARNAERLLSQLRAEETRRKEQLAEIQAMLRDLPGIRAEGRPEGNVIVMPSEILFESGRIELNEAAKASLDRIAGYLAAHGELTVRIDGHTDGQPIRVSPWDDNYHLAAMRAHSVMKYLVAKGVRPDRMYIAGFGPNRPRVPPPSPEASVAENRRVEIVLIPTGATSVGDILERFQK